MVSGNPGLANQPCSQGSLLPALSRSVGRVGENPGNEVFSQQVLGNHIYLSLLRVFK